MSASSGNVFRLRFSSRATLLVACGMIAVLSGCRAKSPLAPSSAAVVDERLVGVWEQLDESGESSAEGLMMVVSFGPNEYLAGRLALGDEFLDPEELYRVYITEHQGYRYLNLQGPGDPENYFFVRIDLLDEEMAQLRMLPERIFPSEDMSSTELVGFLVEHADDPAVFPEDGILRYRKLGEDLDFPWPRGDEFDVRFGLIDRVGGLYQETTTIPLRFCADRRFGFEITPPDGSSYDYYSVHEMPAPPRVFSGTVLDPGPPFRLQSDTTTSRSEKLIVYGFDDGDSPGAYHTEIYINRDLALAVDYTVVEVEDPYACDE